MAKKQTKKDNSKKGRGPKKAASASKLTPEKRRERARRAAEARWRKVFLVLGPE